VGGAWFAYGGWERFAQGVGWEMRPLGYPDVDGRKIRGWISKRLDWGVGNG
jgi:hypothetical protein